MDIPATFYLLSAISLSSAIGGIVYKSLLWLKGKNVHEINFKNFIHTITLNPLLKKHPLRWLSHTLIFFSFVMLFLIGSVGDFLHDHKIINLPKDTPWFATTNDILGILLIAGVTASIIHRILSKDIELRRKNEIALLLLLLIIGISGFATELARLKNSRFHMAIWWGHAILSLTLIGISPWTFLIHPIPSGILSILSRDEKYFYTDGFKTQSFSLRDLVSLDACTRCGMCTEVCEIYKLLQDEAFAPRGKIKETKLIIKGKPLSERFSEGVFGCTLCGRCNVVCPSGIQTKDIMLSMRYCLKDENMAPRNLYSVSESILKEYNVFGYPNDERRNYLEFIDDAKDVIREESGILYFVGCLSSFSPPAQEIPQSITRIIKKLGLSISLMEEEVCCGYPLLIGGFLREAEKLREKNLKEIEKIKPHTIIFNCPSCLYTWRKFYSPFLGKTKLLHITQFLLLQKLPPLKNEGIITYHDPCDLGRGNGIYEEPRQLLKMIEGVRFVEMKENRKDGFCCGGGGDIEMFAPSLSERVAELLIERANEVANTLITACPQCKRMALKGKKEKKIAIYDITEYILTSMKDG